ncbi:hypothetical protein ACHQM5_002645 [Ranunculus cassubicifolius]
MEENVNSEPRDPQGRDDELRFDNNSTSTSSNGGSNAARYKLMSPARLPISRSPCLTIPPGLSPTTLLDSPVLLSNMKAEPSPTTGTFNKPHVMYDTIVSDGFSSPRDTSNNDSYDGRSSRAFEFKPHVRTSSGLSSLGPMACGGPNSQQYESFGQVQATPNPPNSSSHMVSARDITPAEIASEEVTRKVFYNGLHETQSDHKEPTPLVPAERSSDDGYNWRKYGQKHVKGCEFPRSYYKCTHPNCQVKKQLERSHDGQITEIIYKGKHDHPKSQPSRRMTVGTIVAVQEEGSDRFSSLNSTEDNLSNAYAQTYHQIQPNGSPEFLPITAGDDNVDGIGIPTNGIINEVEEEEDDDPESKRRKKDTGGIDVTLMSKATREPRVVVQTLSEVDILDDGYRWRKYGQKVVKGNPNPRSYYKCTNAGCPVRKHVERASHDPKAVITTYEGKHNHDVPASRTSAHDTAAAAAATAYHNNHNTNNNNNSVGAPSINHQQHQMLSRSQEIDTVSLDLGVGISMSPEHNEFLQHHQNRYPYNITSADPGGSSRMTQPGGADGRTESFSFETRPLTHSSNPYQQHMGRLMMGP